MTHALVAAAYGEMEGDASTIDLDYTVGRDGADAAFYIARPGRKALTAPDDGTFLALFDEDIAIELQKLRRELYFVHAAVLSRGEAVMLVAKPGGGKSTLTWALLHHGFGFLSDELAPVDLDTLEVHPYPRTLALKREPPGTYPLPRRTVVTSRSLHVRGVLGSVVRAPAALGAVVFLQYNPDASGPTIRRLTRPRPAHASMRTPSIPSRMRVTVSTAPYGSRRPTPATSSSARICGRPVRCWPGRWKRPSRRVRANSGSPSSTL